MTAHATHEVDLSELRAEWTGAFDLAREYLALHPGARVMLARHRRSGLWAATDLALNPAAEHDSAWFAHVMCSRSGLTGYVSAWRYSRTPCGRAVWVWARRAGSDEYAWRLDDDATSEGAATILRDEGHLVGDTAHWSILAGGVPA